MRISERTAVTVTSFAGMVKVVSAADALDGAEDGLGKEIVAVEVGLAGNFAKPL